MALEGFLGLNRALAGGILEVFGHFWAFLPIFRHFEGKNRDFRAHQPKKGLNRVRIGRGESGNKGYPLGGTFLGHFWLKIGYEMPFFRVLSGQNRENWLWYWGPLGP